MAYNTTYPVKIITSGNMAGNLTSLIVETKLQDNIGIQLDWTGTPTGIFDVQVSVDHTQDAYGNVTNAGHWVSLSLSTTIKATGSADDAYIDLNQLAAPYVKVVYTATSGTGTLNAYVTGKGV